MSGSTSSPDPNAPVAPVPAPVQQQPQQLTPPVQEPLLGANWARNLALFGGDFSSAMGQRTGSGFLANPGGASFGIGLGGAYKDASALDKQNADAQQTMALTAGQQLSNQAAPTRLSLEQAQAQQQKIKTQLDIAGYNMSADLYGLPKLDPTGKPISATSNGTEINSQTIAPGNPNDPNDPNYTIKDEDIRNRIVNKAIAANGADGVVNPQMLYSLIQHESSWRPNISAPTSVTKPDGTVVPTNSSASGLGQIEKSTAQQYGVAPASFGSIKDPQTNVNLSVKILKDIADKNNITAADLADPARGPGLQAFMLTKYHGPTDALGTTPQAYVTGIAQDMAKRKAAQNGQQTNATGLPPPPIATAAPQNGAVQEAGLGAPTGTSVTPAPTSGQGIQGNPNASPAQPPSPSLSTTPPTDAHTLARMYVQGNLPNLTPQQAGVIAPLLAIAKHPLAQAVADYATAGPKAAAIKSAEGNWVPDTQNGVPGNKNTVTGEFKPTVTSAGRITYAPDGSGWESPPGGGAPRMVVPANNQGVGAKAAASAQGAETGKTAGELPEKLVAVGQKADAAMGNIDVGLAAMDRMQKSGITPGYFAPWYSTGAAMAKNLGINIPGVDANAVPDAQLAQKTLGIVSGSILQQTIGGDSQITDAKIQHFIHTQPGIETDPQAIQKVLGWARTQFQYEHDMAMDGMSNVDKTTGNIPPGWQAGYYAKQKAFAPIYDPLTQETKQPQGEAPPREPPKSEAPAATTSKPQPKYAEGQTATGPGGKKMTFINGAWK
jgi:hypothetical protein